MPFDWSELAKLVKAAEKAVEEDKIPVSGVWSAPRKQNSTYLGGKFKHDGSEWVACRGEQRTGYARLLDATGALKARSGAKHAVALLRPPDEPRRGPADADYHRRFQTAAWVGLGIVWAPTHEYPRKGPLEPIVFPKDLGNEIDLAVRNAARPAWKSIKKSRDAEARIHPILDRLLADRGFARDKKRFLSYWRQGETDGTWRQASGSPRTIALEVKVNEDGDAPFGQIIDDLGAFDAVVQVRLVTSGATPKKVHEVPGLSAARERVRERLPVKLIEVLV